MSFVHGDAGIAQDNDTGLLLLFLFFLHFFQEEIHLAVPGSKSDHPGLVSDDYLGNSEGARKGGGEQETKNWVRWKSTTFTDFFSLLCCASIHAGLLEGG